MTSKLKDYWKKTEGLRQSMPEIVPEFYKDIFDLKEGETYFDKINKKLLEYEEVKYVCKKTKIKPFYYLILVIIALSFILVGYFSKYLTLLLATIYPLFMTFKALQYSDENEKKEQIIHWLKYWIFYCVFLNFECCFGNFFKNFYFFFKIIFLISCFPLNSRLTAWIYNTCLGIVRKYEPVIVSFCKNVYEHIVESNEDKIAALQKMKKKDDDLDNINLADYIKDNGGKAALNIMKKIY